MRLVRVRYKRTRAGWIWVALTDSLQWAGELLTPVSKRSDAVRDFESAARTHE